MITKSLMTFVCFPEEISSGDILEYMSEGDVTGTRLNDMKTNTPIYTGLNVVDLHFVSDNLFEDRGFWIKYAGMIILVYIDMLYMLV